MTWMQDVEDTVGEHNHAALMAQALHQRHGLVTQENAAHGRCVAACQSVAEAGPVLKRMPGENVQR